MNSYRHGTAETVIPDLVVRTLWRFISENLHGRQESSELSPVAFSNTSLGYLQAPVTTVQSWTAVK